MYLCSMLCGQAVSGVVGTQRRPDRVEAADEVAVLAQDLEDPRADARHDVHVGDDVGRVRDLDADVRDRRPDGTHRVGDHVHGPAGHRAVEQGREGRLHLGRVGPVVGGAGVLGTGGADEGAILDPGDVRGVGAHEHAVGAEIAIERDGRPRVDHQADHLVVLGLRAVAPLDPLGPGQGGDLADPRLEPLVAHHVLHPWCPCRSGRHAAQAVVCAQSDAGRPVPAGPDRPAAAVRPDRAVSSGFPEPPRGGAPRRAGGSAASGRGQPDSGAASTLQPIGIRPARSGRGFVRPTAAS